MKALNVHGLTLYTVSRYSMDKIPYTDVVIQAYTQSGQSLVYYGQLNSL